MEQGMELQGAISAIMATNQRDIGIAVGDDGRLFWRTDMRGVPLETWAECIKAAQAAAWDAGYLQQIDRWADDAFRRLLAEGFSGHPRKLQRAAKAVNMGKVHLLDATFAPPSVVTPQDVVESQSS